MDEEKRKEAKDNLDVAKKFEYLSSVDPENDPYLKELISEQEELKKKLSAIKELFSNEELQEKFHAEGQIERIKDYYVETLNEDQKEI